MKKAKSAPKANKVRASGPKASSKARPKAKKETPPKAKTRAAPSEGRRNGPVLVVYHDPPLSGPPADPALLALSRTDRITMLARAARDLGLSGIDRLSMLAAEYSTIYRQDPEHPQAGDTLALARILKAACLAMAAHDQGWFDGQANQAKAYLERTALVWTEEQVFGGDPAYEERPELARKLRYFISEKLEDCATPEDARSLADSLLHFLFIGQRRSAFSILVDLPRVPTIEAIRDAARAALPGLRRGGALDAYRAQVADVRRRDPWAFWPEAMREQCEAVSRAIKRVLDNADPRKRSKTAEALIKAALNELGYPKAKRDSLFAAPSTI